MIRTYENGCKHYKPTLRLVCSILSLTISLCEFTLAIYEYSFSRGGNIIAAIFACVFSFHGCITFLYFIGVLRRNPCFQVPFLTLQLIFMTSLGLLVVVWWIATLLAAFDLVHYRSPIENLTNCEFFMAAGGVLLVLFILWMKISLVLYRGYVRTEREAHYRRRLSCGLQLSRSSGFRSPRQVLYNLVFIIVLRSKEGFVHSCIATRSPERGLGGGRPGAVVPPSATTRATTTTSITTASPRAFNKFLQFLTVRLNQATKPYPQCCAQDCPSIYDDNCNGLMLLMPCSNGQSVMAAVNQVGDMQLCQQTANCMIDTLLYYYTAQLMPGMQVGPDGQVLCSGSGWFVRINNNDIPIIGASCASDAGNPP
ncbi:unnamed protein product [Cylicocyclus nassatus]|uniref:Uncharacterized protein n=1 Tax=Cylicocyclus nassatus TaxID=53992 RepID=A0AA36HGM3_CYLNA|nr:unnamed protein product [Cylicocyclus nassatus]